MEVLTILAHDKIDVIAFLHQAILHTKEVDFAGLFTVNFAVMASLVTNGRYRMKGTP